MLVTCWKVGIFNWCLIMETKIWPPVLKKQKLRLDEKVALFRTNYTITRLIGIPFSTAA